MGADRIDVLPILRGAIDHGNEFHVAAVAAITNLLDAMNSLQRYDTSIGGGCACCGTWVEHEQDDEGDWVKHSDIASALASIGAAA